MTRALAAALLLDDRELWAGLPMVFAARLDLIERGRLAVCALASLPPDYHGAVLEAAAKAGERPLPVRGGDDDEA